MNIGDAISNNALNELVPMFTQFAVVAQESQITRAAARLGVPQPTVTRHIARLENVLGVRLFVRTPRGLELTDAGRDLRGPVERALDHLAEGIARLDTDAPEAPIALGFLHTLGEVVVPDLLRRYAELSPATKFTVTQDSADKLLTTLVDGGADLCLTSPPPAHAEVECGRLGTQRLVLAVPESHDMARHDAIELSAAASDDFVTLAPGNHMRQLTDKLCREAGFEPRIAFEASGVSTVRGLVAVGMGVAVTPSAPAPVPGLIELPLLDEGAYREVVLAWRARGHYPNSVLQFRDCVASLAVGTLRTLS
jgi:DNA-binding transcriptional LysR family regulator